MITLIDENELGKLITTKRICTSAIYDNELIRPILANPKTETYYFIKEDAEAIMEQFEQLESLVVCIEEARNDLELGL